MRTKFKKSEQGQSLVETLAGVFVLVMGVAGVAGLSVFAFNNSGAIVKQTVAVGLAREGLEAVRNMRDSNWQKITSPQIETTCYNFVTGASDDKCYYKNINDQWLSPNGGVGFDIRPPSAGNAFSIYTGFGAGVKFWNLNTSAIVGGNWGLNFDSNIAGAGFSGFYNSLAGGVRNGTSDFFRQVVVTTDTTEPYDRVKPGPKLKISSRVWWAGKRCPRVLDWPGAGKCAVELTSYLTNWKNY